MYMYERELLADQFQMATVVIQDAEFCMQSIGGRGSHYCTRKG